MTEFEKLNQDYLEMFDDSFPTFPFMGESEENIIKIIKRCLKEGKDVYDLGILNLDVLY